MAAAHEEYLFRMETQPEDIPGKQPESSVQQQSPLAAIPPGDSTAGAAATADGAASVGSPLMYQPRSVGPPPPVSNNSMMYPLHMMVDVKTPKSAPPVLLDCSPGGGGGSMVSPSPQGGQQQPMSAPSLLYGGDETELDYGGNLLDHQQQQQQQVVTNNSSNNSMPSMPCLVGGDEEDEGACPASAQNPPAPDVVNQHQPDSEYIMDILKDIEALGRTFFYSFKKFILDFYVISLRGRWVAK
jgi:hypothetical protein